jgi:hypothetical protein
MSSEKVGFAKELSKIFFSFLQYDSGVKHFFLNASKLGKANIVRRVHCKEEKDNIELA